MGKLHLKLAHLSEPQRQAVLATLRLVVQRAYELDGDQAELGTYAGRVLVLRSQDALEYHFYWASLSALFVCSANNVQKGAMDALTRLMGPTVWAMRATKR